jgi:hypothetical protein
MKNKKRRKVIVSALFALLCLAQTASAFYAPNLQRWVNRDPIGEKGFELARRRHDRPQFLAWYTLKWGQRLPNLHRYVGNKPLETVDPFGLITPFEGLSICVALEWQIQAISEELTVQAGAGATDPETEATLIALLAMYDAFCKLPPRLPPPPPDNPIPVPVCPNPSLNKVAQETTFWGTVAIVGYWVISEGSRILFPPRNLVPVL